MRNRAWLMCRFEDSSLSPVGLISLKAQEDELRRYCSDHDLEIAGASYIWGKNTAEFDNTIFPKAADHAFDLLLATSASRIGRDIEKVIKICKTLEESNIGVICVKENTATPSALKCLYENYDRINSAFKENQNTTDSKEEQGGLAQ